GGAQRPLSLGQISRPGGEIQGPAEPIEDLRRAQGADAGGGELDREREAAETLADRPDRGGSLIAEDQAGPVGPGPFLEELDARGGVQWRNRVALLAADPQQLAARGEHAQVRRGPDERRDGLGGR